MDEDAAVALADALGAPRILGRCLWTRGLRTAAEAGSFLEPRLLDLEPPGALPDVAKASERIVKAIRGGERIAVCGDYDVDGMTGTALLVRFLRLAGADVVYAIPDRESDGYGLSIAGVERLHAKSVRVAVTVDNGVSAVAPIARATALGIDVVVTDHHLPGPELPPAFALVVPRLARGADGAAVGHGEGAASVPGVHLCGCGLAFKLAWSVAERMPQALRDERLRGFLRDAVGLVALATVSDVVPLRGENRILVAAGLRALRATPHPGVRALLEIAGVGALPLTTDDIGWRLAPRLNAAGRLNRPDLAIDLLSTDDEVHARTLAEALDRANDERRVIERGVVAEAQAEARLRVLEDAGDGASLVVSGEGWHRGVLGIVAARLVDAHDRPSVVIGLDDDGGRGSARSARAVNLFEALDRCRAHLRRYGGHAAAAGLEIERDAVPAFRAAFDAAVREQTAASSGPSALALDGEARPEEFSLEAAVALARLGPFGEGNPEPRFVLRGVTLAGRAKTMGAQDDHLSFALKTPTGAIRVVAFRQAKALETVAAGRPFDLAASPSVNEWRGVRTPELVAHEIRPRA